MPWPVALLLAGIVILLLPACGTSPRARYYQAQANVIQPRAGDGSLFGAESAGAASLGRTAGIGLD